MKPKKSTVVNNKCVQIASKVYEYNLTYYKIYYYYSELFFFFLKKKKTNTNIIH